MKILERILIGLQVLFVVFGLVMMVNNIIDTSRLGLPYTAYDERIFLMHTLNAVQALVMFGAALALEPIISKLKARLKRDEEA